MTFRVGVMCGASGEIVQAFLAHNAPRLRQEADVEVAAVVLDEDAPSRQTWRHLWRLAGRQARLAGCARVTAAVRILVYRALTEHSGGARPGQNRPFPPGPSVIRVPTLNAPAATEAVRGARCDFVCLMGARILTRRTLRAIAVPITNVHSSDPRWVRGGPVVVWEVLAGRPAITLVVHEVTDVLDAGAILAQADQPLLYRGGLGETTVATMVAARPRVGALFERVIRDAAAGRPQRTSFVPGTLKVTPSVPESLRAEILCRRRSARARPV